MIGLALDENFNHDILRGMLRRNASLDVVRLQEAGLSGQDDPTVLEWAAQQSRVLISQISASRSGEADQARPIRRGRSGEADQARPIRRGRSGEADQGRS